MDISWSHSRGAEEARAHHLWLIHLVFPWVTTPGWLLGSMRFHCKDHWHQAFLCRLVFAYEILTPAALNFFVQYADGAVESLWSIDQYFEFVLVLLLSTGLSFQVRRSISLLSALPASGFALLHAACMAALIRQAVRRSRSSRSCLATLAL